MALLGLPGHFTDIVKLVFLTEFKRVFGANGLKLPPWIFVEPFNFILLIGPLDQLTARILLRFQYLNNKFNPRPNFAGSYKTGRNFGKVNEEEYLQD